MFVWASNEVRREFHENTWQAFWQTAVEGRSVKQVAERLKMSAGSIYVAKSRILTRIKERIEEAEGDLSRVGKPTNHHPGSDPKE